ncbi:MAG: hypothetical protein UR26_C0001G0105 [candidate division TM6 bacterium GW2011_GWF2_32_72]|nr:MAG: hypothetical protein UR26_C0001G0105 [candidate division TM6 bacterium GW2011_GWF2_32_72]
MVNKKIQELFSVTHKHAIKEKFHQAWLNLMHHTKRNMNLGAEYIATIIRYTRKKWNRKKD